MEQNPVQVLLQLDPHSSSLHCALATGQFSAVLSPNQHALMTSAVQGSALACGASTVLAAAMGKRAIKSFKFMPAGPVAVVGTASALYQGRQAYRAKQ